MARTTSHRALSFRPIIAVYVALIPLVPASVYAANEAAKLYSTEGAVERRPAASDAWEAAPANTVFYGGDSIRTGEASRAAIVGSDGVMVRLNANALIKFDAPAGGQGGALEVGQGDAYVLSRDPHTVPNVTTSLVSGSIRGTEFAVSVKSKQVTFSVINGVVALNNQHGSVTLGSGEEAVTEPGKAPMKRIMVRPFDAVQWALRYPAMVSATSAKRLESLAKGNNAAALILRSGKALEAGQVESAQGYQDSAEKELRSKADDAASFLRAMLLAQKAVVAIVKNQREDAENALHEAEAASPGLVDTLYSSSLLAQSRGDMDGARSANDAALKVEPANSLLLARAAELAFGFGDSLSAEKLVNEALSANPQDADAETVSGFIFLARGEIERAHGAFDRALAANASNAGAHLGKGIAEIRGGALDDGRIEIQKAVHLEPTTALYRSYLGKAFFENEKEELAGEELKTAASIDPLDPTPHLYIAFNNLARYLPVPALRSLEESIRLNDNRAVYRSRLLLDQDKATRSAGLGKIFAALDFVTPARIEALKSLTEDPTNYSAHFLLKDSLIGPETDSAAVAEDVVGTLLAPSTFSALLPTASGAATLNDYTTLFERIQSRAAVDVVAESHQKSVQTSEVYIAGGNDYSYLLRHGMTYSDGYRENDFSRSQTGRILFQHDLTPDDKILVEGIAVGNDFGDTGVGTDPTVNDPDLEFTYEDYVGRMGYHHAWGVQSHLIAQALYINSRFRTLDRSQERAFTLAFENPDGSTSSFIDGGVFDVFSRARTRGGRGDLQHLWSSEYFSVVSGASLLGFDEKQEDLASTTVDDLGVFDGLNLESAGQPDTKAYRAYSYVTAKPTQWARLIGGANYSDTQIAARTFEPWVDDDYTISGWSPKVGAVFYPTSHLTARATYFEAVGQASGRDLEGIEPSQLAGFLQTFDDRAGTESENYAFGVDWKLPGETYVGSEFLSRNLKQTEFSATQGLLIDAESTISDSIASERSTLYGTEQSINNYWNQVICRSLVGSVEHTWVESESEAFDSETRTNRVRLGMNYFDPSGFFSFASATWRHQNRDAGPDSEDEESDFWIASGGIGWQLPHRHGSIQLAARNIFERKFIYEPVGSDVVFFPDVDISLGISLNF